ncbi:MAG: electron transfer flavoprotein subunit beta/FixA family protein [Candidatus Bathyarchaeia archaeon]|jgi:electron transfer flavoprotein beta subunit
MKRIIVCLKQAVDVSQLKIDPATRQLITAGAPRKISDFDKNALEEALRIKEKLGGIEIFTLTIDSEDAKAILREALAMGADKAYFVNDPAVQAVDTLGTAYILAQMVRKIGEFDLILGGESSLDSFSGLVGSRLSELLGLPQVSSVRKLTVDGDTIVAERALEDSSEVVKTKIPAVVTVTREINQPRIPSLMMIMKASKKEIVKWTLADIDTQKEKIVSKVEVLEALAPKMERKKIIIKGDTVQEIAEKLAKALIQEGVIGK